MGTFATTPIEAVRDYWNARPCNIRHSQKPRGTQAYFDEVETRKYFVEPHIPEFAEFPRWNDKTVLEIGCGIGTDTINFLRNGAKVRGRMVKGEGGGAGCCAESERATTRRAC